MPNYLVFLRCVTHENSNIMAYEKSNVRLLNQELKSFLSILMYNLLVSDARHIFNT